MTDLLDHRVSHSILDRIKLFEGSSLPHESSIANMKKTSVLKSITKPWGRDKAREKEVSTSTTKNVTLQVREDPKPSPVPVVWNRSPTTDLKKESVTLGEQREEIRENNKGKKNESDNGSTQTLVLDKETQFSPRINNDPQRSPRTNMDPQSSPRTNDPQPSPRTLDPQSSPRTKQKEKVVRLEVEDNDEDGDIVTLQQLSVEEKQMVRNLVKLTQSKVSYIFSPNIVYTSDGH